MAARRVFIPYTCGELFQGTLDGQPCLVSCPITVYSTASVSPDLAVAALPPKARRALDGLHLVSPPAISLRQRLPAGRGYGTSTADIGSVLFAAAHQAGIFLDPLQASRLAAAIEPTDSTFFPGLTLFDHRQARFYQPLGCAPRPAVTIVVLDPGGKVDSEAFNACDWQPALAKLARQHRQVFDLLDQAIATQDVCALGEAATLSAKAHQAILHNPWLEPALSLAKQTGASGICRAHSGTILGLLFQKAGFDETVVLSYLKKHLPDHIRLRVTELTGGGPVEEDSTTPIKAEIP